MYCVSSMGVTGQEAAFHKDAVTYLSEVKAACKIPVMMGFGIRTPEDIAPVRDNRRCSSRKPFDTVLGAKGV